MKLCACILLSIIFSALNFYVALALTIFALLIVMFTLPATAFLSTFAMGFVEQRFSRHWTYCLVAATATLLPPWWLMVAMPRGVVAFWVAIYVPINFVLALGGSAFGVACSGLIYTIVIGPAPGTCSHCGYPLKGLPANRCPECGREFDQNEKETGPH